MESKIYRIIIAGEGGQGVQVLAHAFAQAAFEANLHVSYMPNYGVEQRGGVSLGFLQFGKGVIGFPKFQTADILVVMCSRAIERTKQYVGENTIYIYDSSQIESKEVAEIVAEKLPIPATEYATNKLIPKVFNMILAGAIISEVNVLSRADIEKSLDKFFTDKYKKQPQLRHFNKKALSLGAELAKKAYEVK